VTRILVADDDAALRELVSGLLCDAAYQVVSAADGLEGWELLKSGGADMAVLDLNMPRLDGFGLLKNIRSDPKFSGMPVLMMTGRALVEDQVAGYERGADDYLAKPFDNEVLVARVKVLERRILG
jgi:two-component system response regulator RpaA